MSKWPSGYIRMEVMAIFTFELQITIHHLGVKSGNFMEVVCCRLT